MNGAMVMIQKDSEIQKISAQDETHLAEVEIRKDRIQLSVGAVSVPSPLSTNG